ncbi:16183_t:CDS:2 [Gigaspora margarita]|uniref:16183_t:CDS:1 n=1 Tax=Gigaspora margarita TaxID=4874 RepID=A0ABN7WG67_GIGMA|nr:16183_t:CDS:2 [Gigaspora margarita]
MNTLDQSAERETEKDIWGRNKSNFPHPALIPPLSILARPGICRRFLISVESAVKDKETKAWRDIILMKFLNQPNLVFSKYKPNALYDAFIETDVLEPEHLLTDDKKKRRQARNHLLNGYKFSKEQAFALIPLQRVGRYKSQAPDPERSRLEAEEVNICQVSNSTCTKETIKEMAQRIVRDKLSKRDIKAISRALVETAPDPVERLDLYDVSNTPDKQALANVMIMHCIQPAEIKNLRITNGGVTGYAKNQGQQDISCVFRSLEKNEERAKKLLIWIQEAIVSGQLRDPEKLGSTYLSTFLKKDEFIPKPYKSLLPSSLHKLGSIFVSVVHSAKNLSEANTFASEALRHSPENHTSPSDRYTIAVFASVAHGSKNASKANTYASEALRHSPDNHASQSKRYTKVNM